jgi:hypothetical protein
VWVESWRLEVSGVEERRKVYVLEARKLVELAARRDVGKQWHVIACKVTFTTCLWVLEKREPYVMYIFRNYVVRKP